MPSTSAIFSTVAITKFVADKISQDFHLQFIWMTMKLRVQWGREPSRFADPKAARQALKDLCCRRSRRRCAKVSCIEVVCQDRHSLQCVARISSKLTLKKIYFKNKLVLNAIFKPSLLGKLRRRIKRKPLNYLTKTSWLGNIHSFSSSTESTCPQPTTAQCI